MELITLVFPDNTKYWNNIGFDGIDYITYLRKNCLALSGQKRSLSLVFIIPLELKISFA